MYVKQWLSDVERQAARDNDPGRWEANDLLAARPAVGRGTQRESVVFQEKAARTEAPPKSHRASPGVSGCLPSLRWRRTTAEEEESLELMQGWKEFRRVHQPEGKAL